MRKSMILGALGLVLLAGCEKSADKGAGIPIQKWKGAPYRLAFDTKATKPNASGVTIPTVKYTANPDALETRAVLVVQFELPGAKNEGQPMHHMVAAPVDIHGEEGSLPADYTDRASKDLSEYLTSYCAEGKVNMSVALARSSLNRMGSDAEIDAKRLSDWLPMDAVIKKPRGKC